MFGDPRWPSNPTGKCTGQKPVITLPLDGKENIARTVQEFFYAFTYTFTPQTL